MIYYNSHKINKLYNGSDLVEQMNKTVGGSRLPQGYTEVEYIKNYILTANASSTLAYLDTNFTPTEKTRVLIDMQIDKVTKNPRLFGSGMWNGLGYILNCEETIGQSNSYIYYKFGQNSTWYHTTVHPDLLRHTIDYNNNGEFLLDGTSIATLPTTSFTAPISMGVFTGRRTGSTVVDLGETFYGKVYSCKIYEDGTLVRDFVPCTNPNSVAGFYDLVNNVFYGSANNNTFTAGNTVTPAEDKAIFQYVSD